MNARPWFRSRVGLASLLLAATSAIALPDAMVQAQAPTTAVGTTSAAQTATVTITTAGTLSKISVLTQGATGLDYKVVTPNGAPTPCTVGTAYTVNDTCTVQYTFTPSHPFVRYGGIALADAAGKLLGNVYLTGAGTGPQVTYPPSTTTVPTTITGVSLSASGLAVDGSGNLYAADTSTNSVKEIMAVGGTIPQNPTVTTLVSGLTAANGVAVDGSGNVFYLDGNSLKELVAVDGTIPASPTTRSLTSTLNNPGAIAVDGLGDVFVADTANGVVKKVAAVNGVIPATPTITTVATSTNTLGVAVDGSGNVFYTSGSQQVFEHPAGGGADRLLTTVSSLDSLAIDAAGDLYLGDSVDKFVYEVAAVGGTIATNSTAAPLGTGFSGPKSVAADSSGNVFVGDSNGAVGTVKELNVQTPPTITFTSTAAGTTSSDSPMTLTVANNGNQPLVFAIPSTGTNPSISSNFVLSPTSSCPQLTSTSGSTLSLPAGNTCTDLISFKPGALGPVTGSLTTTDDNLNATGATQVVPLVGGTATPSVTVSPVSTPVDSTSVTLTAQVNYNGVAPTGAFTFSVNGGAAFAATCTGSSSPLTCTASYDASSLTVGSYPIVGSLASDPSNNSASGNGMLTITTGTPTVALSTSGSPVPVNSPITFTAAVTPNSGTAPTGKVSFSATLSGTTTTIAGCSSVSLVSGSGPTSLKATCTTSALTAGTYTISAALAGDSNFNSATSNSLPQTVSAVTPTLALSTSNASPAVDASVTLTAAVTPNSGIVPSGKVSFTTTLNGSTSPIAGCTSVSLVSGAGPTLTATCTTSALLAGSNAVSANLSSDSNFNTATSNTVTETVSKSTTTLALASSQPAASTVDQPVTFTATLSSSFAFTTTPAGTVSFTAGGTVINGCGAVLVSSTTHAATCTTSALLAPSDLINATYSGDANFNTSNAPQLGQNVNKNTPVNTVASSLATTAIVNQTVTFTATITPNGASASGVLPTGNVTFTRGAGGPVVCSQVAVNGNAANGTGTASCVTAFTTAFASTGIYAVYSGDGDFTAGVAPNVAQTVSPAPTTTTVTSGASSNVNQAVILTASLFPTNSGVGYTGNATPQSGTLTFSDSLVAGTFCSTTITAGAPNPVTCSHTFTTTGNHVITAAFTSTDPNFNSSTTNNSVTQTVNAAGTTTLAVGNAAGATTPTVNQQTTFTATFQPAFTAGQAVPQGTVSYSDSLAATNPICANLAVSSTGTVPNCTETLLVAGTHVITAVFTSSNANFGTITSQNFVQVVAQNTPTVTLTSPSSSNSSVDQVLTFTATVTPATLTPAAVGNTTPTGALTFSYVLNGSTTTICSPQVSTSGSVTSATCSAALTTAGNYTITATYAGDTNFKSAASAAHPQTVAKTGTSLGLVSGATLSSPSSPAVNQSAAYSVQLSLNGGISDSGLTVPTGNVVFTDSATNATCSAVVASNGQATCSFAEPTGGAHSIVATYGGDANFSATTATFAESIGLNATTVSGVGATPASPAVNQNTALNAVVTPNNPGSATPTGTVTFSDSAPGIATTTCVSTLADGTVPSCAHIFTSAGNHTLTATYSGDSNFATSATSTTVNVTVSGTTSITVSTATPSPTVNQQVTFNAAFSSLPSGGAQPQGTVSYFDTLVGSSPISTCTNLTVSNGAIPNCVETMFVAGTHNISATFTSSNSNFSTITSSIFPENVAQNTVTTAITSPTSSSSSVDQVLTFTATVTPATLTPAAVGNTNPTGSITFSYVLNGTPTTICTPTVSTTGGVTSASCSAPLTVAGTYAITAIYSGDTNFKTNTSPSHPQTVNKTGTSLALASGSTLSTPSSPAVNQTATYTVQLSLNGGINDAGLSMPTGNVIFTDSATSASCSAVVSANGQASCSFPEPTSGSHTIVAAYGGDSNFSPSMQSFTETVALSPTAVTNVGSTPPSPSVNQTGVTLNAMVAPANSGTAIPSGTVTFTDSAPGGGTTTCTSTLSANGMVPPCPHIFTSAGTHTITAAYSGDGNFSPSSSGSSVTVGTAGTTSINIATTTPSPIVNQQATFTASFSGLPQGGAQPQGTISYFDTLVSNSTPISTCTNLAVVNGAIPNCVETLFVAGTHNISAIFTSSNNNFQTISSAIFPENVAQNSTSVAITSPTSAISSVDQLQTFSATVTPAPLTPAGPGNTSPTGSVTFSYSAVFTGSSAPTTGIICAANISTTNNVSSATCSTPVPLSFAGAYTITASYSADSNFLASSITARQTVGKTATTLTIYPVNAPPSPQINVPFTFSPQLTTAISDAGLITPTGLVTLTDGNQAGAPIICNVQVTANGSVNCPPYSFTTAGTHTIYANYVGDNNFSSSVAVASVTVTSATPAVSVTSSLPTSIATQTVTFTATVAASPAGNIAPTNPVANNISFTITQGSTQFACSRYTQSSAPAQASATCTVTFSNAIAGTVSVVATYNGDSNYGKAASPAITQTVENFIPTIAPAQILLAQGSVQGSNSTPNTNLNDAYNAATLQLTSSPENGFADPTAVTACTVADSTGAAVAGLTCAPLPASAGTGVALLTATAAVAPGVYTVQYIVSDVNPTPSNGLALSQTATSTVTIINQPAQLFTLTQGSVQASFTLPPTLAVTDPSTLSCNTNVLATGNANGTYTTATNQTFASIGIHCSAITGSNPYNVTITAGAPASARLETQHLNGILAAVLGAPFLLLFGLLPSFRSQRKLLLRVLGIVLLAAAVLQTTGCGGGGFVRGGVPTTAISGSYLIAIVNASGVTVAEIPIVIAGNSK